MPPPVESDDESTGSSIPYNHKEEAKGTTGKAAEPAAPAAGEEMFDVEQIVGHEFGKNGALLLQVKWKNYPDPADQTLEPEANMLEDAKDLVDEYYDILGGRPKKPTAGRKRKSLGAANPATEKPEPKKQRRSTGASGIETPDETENLDWVPKSKNWENLVERVDTIIRDAETGTLLAFLHWHGGKKSKVSIETCYQKCPQQMLKFYEQHLVFKEG